MVPTASIDSRPPPAGQSLRWTALVILASAAAVAWLFAPAWGDWAALTPDSLDYLGLARGLSEGDGLPARRLIRPPGYSLALVPLMQTQDTFQWIKLLHAACWAATAGLTVLLLTPSLGRPGAAAGGLLVATHDVLLDQVTHVWSEPLFTALLMATLVWLERMNLSRVNEQSRDRKGAVAARSNAPLPSRPGFWSAVAAGLVVAGLTMIRSMALVLAVPMAWALWRKTARCMPPEQGSAAAPASDPTPHASTLNPQAASPKPQALRLPHLVPLATFILCLAAPLLAWNLRQSSYSQSSSYAQTWLAPRPSEDRGAGPLRLQLSRFIHWLPERLDSIKQVLVPKRLGGIAFHAPLATAATWIIGGGIVLLLLLRLWRERSPVDLYVLLTLLMLSLWPWDEGVRLVSPLIPVLIGVLPWLFLRLWQRRGCTRWERAVLAIAAVIFSAAWIQEARLARARLPAERRHAEERWARMRAVADWRMEHLPPDARMIGLTPPGSGHKAILAGAAYLTRTPIEYLEVEDGRPILLPGKSGGFAFIHESLYAEAPRQGGGTLPGRVDEFVVTTP